MSDINLISPDHPWIDFKFDVSKLSYLTWIDLGECSSKCEHIANTPMDPDLRGKLHNIYLSKGVHATTAIEGNTLSEAQVLLAVDSKLEVPESKEYLKREVENVIDAVNVIGKRINEENEQRITPELLCEYNGMVLKDIELDEGVVPGELRKINVGVGGSARYSAPQWKYVESLFDQFCKKLEEFDKIQKLPLMVRAILKATFAHLYFVWIHPFGDGNGRTARLLEFDILLRSGVPSAAAHLLSNHYNATRTEYYRRLDRASKARDAVGFVSYASQGFRDGLKEQLEHINESVIKTVWINYVHEKFRQIKTTATTRRRREVVLAISEQPGKTASQIPGLTVELLNEYRGKTDKTLTRDIRALLKMKMIVEVDGKYMPGVSLMGMHFPMRRENSGSLNSD